MASVGTSSPVSEQLEQYHKEEVLLEITQLKQNIFQEATKIDKRTNIGNKSGYGKCVYCCNELREESDAIE